MGSESAFGLYLTKTLSSDTGENAACFPINPTAKREGVPLRPRTSLSIWVLQSILISSTAQPSPISARAVSLASSTDSPPTTTLRERDPPFCLTRIAY